MAFGLYLHIPYCEGKCFYCDFYSKGGSRAVPESYIEALLREMRRFCNCECASLRPDTLYFGGGTAGALGADTAGSAARRAPRESPCGPDISAPLPAAPADSPTLDAHRAIPAFGNCDDGIQNALGADSAGSAARRAPRESPCGPEISAPLPAAPADSPTLDSHRAIPAFGNCDDGIQSALGADSAGSAARRAPRESLCGPEISAPLPAAPADSPTLDAQYSSPASLYFGGGTPSLLTPAQVARLIGEAAPAPGAEITLEANPDTVTLDSLRGYRRAGVNRLSIGVQSASDEQLRRLGRPHNAAAARRALELAREAGFENISGDVMLALPHYSREEFDATLELLVSGGVTHISCYLLKIEPKTRFGLHPPQGLPGEDEAADFYLYAVERLAEAGFAQYEISNFARPGYESRHNLIYWNCGDYLGLGPAAYSCMGGERFHYPPDLNAFWARMAPVTMDGRVDAEDYIMLQTRLASGLSLPELRRRWGLKLDERQKRLLAACQRGGLCRLSDDRLTLTPRGMLVQNSILTEVF